MMNLVNKREPGVSTRILEVPRLSRLEHLKSLRPFGSEGEQSKPFRPDVHIRRELVAYHEHRHAFAADRTSDSRVGVSQSLDEQLQIPKGSVLLQVPLTRTNLPHLERLTEESPSVAFFWKHGISNEIYTYTTQWRQGQMLHDGPDGNAFEDLKSRLIITRAMIEDGFAHVERLIPALTADGKSRAHQFREQYNRAQPPLVYLVVTEAEAQAVCSRE